MEDDQEPTCDGGRGVKGTQGQIYILFRAPGHPSEWKTRRQNGNSRQNLARMGLFNRIFARMGLFNRIFAKMHLRFARFNLLTCSASVIIECLKIGCRQNGGFQYKYLRLFRKSLPNVPSK